MSNNLTQDNPATGQSSGQQGGLDNQASGQVGLQQTESLLGLNPYKRGQYQYSEPYNRYQPFLYPLNIDKQLKFEWFRASAVFRKYDANSSGDINRKEFKKAWRELFPQVVFMRGENKRMFWDVDQDNSGRIGEREFCEYYILYHKNYLETGAIGPQFHTPAPHSPFLRGLYVYANPYDRAQPLAPPTNMDAHAVEWYIKASNTFRKHDTNNTGYLDRGEFKKAFREFYPGLSVAIDNDIKSILSVDRGNSERISERDFCEYYVHQRKYNFPHLNESAGAGGRTHVSHPHAGLLPRRATAPSMKPGHVKDQIVTSSKDTHK